MSIILSGDCHSVDGPVFLVPTQERLGVWRGERERDGERDGERERETEIQT